LSVWSKDIEILLALGSSVKNWTVYSGLPQRLSAVSAFCFSRPIEKANSGAPDQTWCTW
jgi:hypothetical protein